MKKITATVPVWITSKYVTLDSLDKSTPERAISTMNYYLPHEDGTPPDGWVQVGTAEITVTLAPQDQIVGNQIAMLKAAQKKVRADAENALNQIEGQIQSLMAIEYQS